MSDDRSAPTSAPAAVRNAILGGLYGLLIGDAVGVPYEFMDAAELPPVAVIDMPPPEFGRSHPNAPDGAWSDDGAQALCLLDSLLHCGQLDLVDFGQRLLRWYTSGYMAVGGAVFDVGTQTRRALDALKKGASPEQSGPDGVDDNGNGSLMRVLPLALWHQGSDAELARDAARQSIVTHAHPRSQVCCALYCLWVRAELNGVASSWEHAATTLRALCATMPVWAEELGSCLRPDVAPAGSGYVVDTLHSARLAAEEGSYQRIVQRAVSFGNDTDTTAAVAGGIGGVRHGLDSIPARWKAALAGDEIVAPLAARLMLSRQTGPT